MGCLTDQRARSAHHHAVAAELLCRALVLYGWTRVSREDNVGFPMSLQTYRLICACGMPNLFNLSLPTIEQSFTITLFNITVLPGFGPQFHLAIFATMLQRIQAVDYRVPAVLQLSSDCHDLLARILVAGRYDKTQFAPFQSDSISSPRLYIT